MNIDKETLFIFQKNDCCIHYNDNDNNTIYCGQKNALNFVSGIFQHELKYTIIYILITETSGIKTKVYSKLNVK